MTDKARELLERALKLEKLLEKQNEKADYWN